MKKYPISIFITIFNYEIFMILVILFLKLKVIKSFSNFKTIYISENNYCVIKQDSINYYSNDQMNSVKTFDDDQMLTTIEELDAVSLDVFKDTPALVNLLVVKDYVYAIASGIHICNGKLSEINDIYSLELKAYEFIYNYCFFVLGLIKTNKDFVLFLYRNSVFDCSNFELDEITINDVDRKSVV